jgi:hypothetical protein
VSALPPQTHGINRTTKVFDHTNHSFEELKYS